MVKHSRKHHAHRRHCKGGSVKHPGFRAVAASIASKEHIPLKNASAILASRTRALPVVDKIDNPRLWRVKGSGLYR